MELPLVGKINRPLPWILGLMTGSLLLLGWFTYRMLEKPSPVADLEKLTVVAQRESLGVEIKANGTVQPVQTVNISPKNSGRLVRLLVEQGMTVKQGQPLAVMENQEIRAQGFEAQAKLKEAFATRQSAEINLPSEIKQAKTRFVQAQAKVRQSQESLKQVQARIPKDIEQANAQLEAAKARFQLTQSRLQRNQDLLKEGAIAQDTYDAAWNDYLGAAANQVEARKRLEQLQSMASPEVVQIQAEIYQAQAAAREAQSQLEQLKGSAPADMGQRQAAFEAAQAQLERVKIQYQDTIIRAPFAGVITQKYATEGAFVTPTTSASSTASATSASIVALAQGLKIVARVPEVDISHLEPGQLVKIVADSFPNENFRGQVIRIAPEAIVDQNVTSFEVNIAIDPEGQKKLRSKMNVDVTFLGKKIPDALVVPTVAIVTEKGATGVMVPDRNNQPQFKPVTVGLVIDDKIQILDGINPGDRVFIDLPESARKSKDPPPPEKPPSP
jgi:HlyD family secretion protein